MTKPKYPIYIPSSGRADTQLTSRSLDRMGVEHSIIVEPDEVPKYKKLSYPTATIIELDLDYFKDYETFDDLGDTASYGAGPARNYAMDLSIKDGHERHWVMDDNIRRFVRLHLNKKVDATDGGFFVPMEEFCDRYENVAMAGPHYEMFIFAKRRWEPFTLNSRIYSCNLIWNKLPYRWHARRNEDTLLSLAMLKDGWCTILFNSFLQGKVATQRMEGGNTSVFYDTEGTLPKSQSLVDLHPDVAKLSYRWGRAHHWVDYRPFKKNKLRLKKGLNVSKEPNNFGMVLQEKTNKGWVAK